MRRLIDRLCFWWLGQTYTRQYNIPYLFGASTSSHDARKKRWQKALTRLWKDKDLLDFLYYQAESDKENVWRGKIDTKLAQGARIRTLYLVFSAHRAFIASRKRKNLDPSTKDELDAEAKHIAKIYKDTVDIEPMQQK